MIKRNLTDDRVFGVMSHFVIEDFYKMDKINELNETLKNEEKVLVYGFGASLVNHDSLVYFDMARWEIQLRYRKGMSNWLCDNPNEDRLKKYKRGFFIEWRTADRLKKKVLKTCDFYIDTNVENDPKMISKDALFTGLNKVSTSPFRLVPYFDPGVWGGQWMKEVCNLDPKESNYAWSFDGVPEEKRTARFVCTICFYRPDNTYFFVHGKCEGRILTARDGEGGFGYDPVFYSDELQCSFGVATAEQKDSVSHRGKALRGPIARINKKYEIIKKVKNLRFLN
jgi:hypothetical protein